MAVRQVVTASETFVQGFVVDSAGLSHWLFERDFPARLLPGEPRGDTEARLPILGASWRIEVDPQPAAGAGPACGPAPCAASSITRTSPGPSGRCWRACAW